MLKTSIAAGTAALLLVSSAILGQSQADATDYREVLVRDGYGYAFGVTAADINGDGLPDLVSADVRADKQASDLYWFENTGDGAFTQHMIASDVPGWLERQAAGDIDGDGSIDIAIVNNRAGEIVWYGQSDGEWTAHLISKVRTAYDVALADIDGDGLLDAASVNMFGGKVDWYRNPGASGRDWLRQTIDSKLVEARTIALADMNGDGRVDIIAAAVGSDDAVQGSAEGPTVAWYENHGPGIFGWQWTKHIVDDQSRSPVHGQPLDMDGDGDIDLVMAFGLREPITGEYRSNFPPEETHRVAWYENLGRGARWQRHFIGRMPFAFEAAAGDIDGDGRIDVVASAWAGGDKIVQFTATADNSWSDSIVSPDMKAANQTILVDLNGDGRLDICATADDGSSRVQGANELRCWLRQ